MIAQWNSTGTTSAGSMRKCWTTTTPRRSAATWRTSGARRPPTWPGWLRSAGGYTVEDEQWWRLTKLYALSRISDYLIELSCPEGDPPPGFGVTGGRPVIGGSTAHRMELAPQDPPHPPDTDHPLDQRRELLLHRCFVRSALPRDEDERFPYDDRLSLAESAIHPSPGR
jgi:hypothetical protein